MNTSMMSCRTFATLKSKISTNLPIVDTPHKVKKVKQPKLNKHYYRFPLRPTSKKFMRELDVRRREKWGEAVIQAPIEAAVLIQRYPVVMRPMKSWEIDFARVKARLYDEVENNPVQPSYMNSLANIVESPQWSLDLMHEAFRHGADDVLKSFIPLTEEEKMKKREAEERRLQAEAESRKDRKGKKKEAAEQKQQEQKQKAAKEKAAKKDAEQPKEDQELKNEAQTSIDAAPLAAAAAEEPVPQIDLTLQPITEVSQPQKPGFNLEDASSNAEQMNKNFKPQPRVTEADKTGNYRTVNRQMWHTLFLLIKKDGEWVLPKVPYQPGTEMVDLARRASLQVLTDKMELYFVGRSPCGYRSNGKNLEFLYRGSIVHGKADEQMVLTGVEDYGWFTPYEFAARIAKGDKDEYDYFIRVFCDDWWEDFDDDKYAVLEDDFNRQKVREVDTALIEERINKREEIEREEKALKKKEFDEVLLKGTY